MRPAICGVVSFASCSVAVVVSAWRNRGGPGREYWQVTRAEKTDYTLDVQFTFRASGDVVREQR